MTLPEPQCIVCVHWGLPDADGLAWCRLPDALGEESFVRCRPVDACEMHSSNEQAREAA